MNRHSIRWKIIGLFVLFILMFQSVFFILSLFLLDDVLLWGTERSMSRQFEQFNKALLEEVQISGTEIEKPVELVLELMSVRFGSLMTFVDLEDGQILSTAPRMMRGDSRHMRQSLLMKSLNQYQHLKIGETVIFKEKSPEMGKLNLIQLGRLEQGFLMIEKPIAAVEENIGILRAYILLSSFGMVLIGSILFMRYSKVITDPIIKIEEQAQSIAGLNFNHRTTIAGLDEIGQLGIAMNSISDQMNLTMTELQLANEKLKNEIEAERRLEKMRRSFVSNVSHELKTPLSMIMGYADGLRHRIVKTPEDVADYSNIIFEESDKMNHLIKDLLDLSAYENGNFTIKKELLDIETVLKDILSLYEAQAIRGEFVLKSQIGSSIEIEGDRLRIEQVIRNLLDNAIKHVTPQGVIQLNCNLVGEHVEITIENEGSQIPGSELPHIWESFFRGEKDILAGYVGTGLGLSIVKAVVEGHQGSISAINTREGVRFIVKLPPKYA